MQLLYGLLFLGAAYPLWLAWHANRRTTLLQTVHWSAAAWLMWVGMLAFNGQGGGPQGEVARYLALCVTGCAGVAVFGARRPGVAAWNFVLLGLLAVMLLPVGHWLVLGGRVTDGVRLLVPAGAIAVTALNYLPTRLAPAALLMGAGCGWELMALADAQASSALGEYFCPGWLCIGLAPWAGWLAHRRGVAAEGEFNRLWLAFRDRYGLVWGQRVREQFNRSAAHAGWPVQLYWQGLAALAGPSLGEAATQDEAVDTLRALLRRFRTDVDDTSPTTTSG
jgi:hypothetical protein